MIDFDGSVTTETYTLSSTSNRLSSVADGSVTRSFTYDASGNVITDDRGGGTVYTLVYADHNRLTEIKSGSTVLASYAYGAFGRRLVKTAGSTTTQFHFGPGGQPIAETDATGSTNVEFIWLGGLPLARIDGGTITYIHADHLNAPQKITDASKTVVWDGAFTPFGKAHALAGSLTHNHRFPGQHYDAIAGYHQNHFRDYAPSLGRYLQSDPIGLNGGLNTYAYVHSNPQNLVDPTGECALAGALFGAAAAAVVDLAEQYAEYLSGRRSCDGFAYDWRRGLRQAGYGAVGGLTCGIGALVRYAGKVGKYAKPLLKRLAKDTQGGGKLGDLANVAKVAAERAKNLRKGIPEKQLGGSGKPRHHSPDLGSRKRAKDAARAHGSGKPIHHPSPDRGKPHWHATTKGGEKGRVHYSYDK